MGVASPDLTVLLLPTRWDEARLADSLASVGRAMLDSGLSIGCLIVECLPEGTDLDRIRDHRISPLPTLVQHYLEREGFDFLVEYGSTARALRRAVRCARGRYVCVLREGDQIGCRLSPDPRIQGDLDVLVGVTVGSPRAYAAHAAMASSPRSCRGLPALVATLTGYDGALLVRRDLLDDVLGQVSHDAKPAYHGYLNEVLTLALLRNSGRVGLTLQVAAFPHQDNMVAHRDRIRGDVLPALVIRRREAGPVFERGTEAVLDAVIGRTFELLTHGPSVLGHSGRAVVGDGTLAAGVEQMLQWLCRQVDIGWDPTAPPVAPTCPQAWSDQQAHANGIPEVSVIASAFRGERFVHSFLDGLLRQTAFASAELIIVLPEPNLVQDLVCETVSLGCDRVRCVPLDHDPGIYECWNLAIRRARGRFISNANLDDRRDRTQLHRLVEALHATGADVASASIAITHDVRDITGFDGDAARYVAGSVREVWFGGSGPALAEKSLNDFFVFDAAGRVQQCMNFPHCMPVWRRSLHDRLGFFDERRNGTYADFAFWLNAAAQGTRFVHLDAPLGVYYVDPHSHNRRNASQVTWHEIVRHHLPPGVDIQAPGHVIAADLPTLSAEVSSSPGAWPRLDFGEQLAQDYGRHRSGWAYALQAFDEFHDPAAQVGCNTFLEKRFVWGSDPGDGGCGPVAPLLRPWVGFIHVPPLVPTWFQFEQSNAQIFAKPAWRRSLPTCRGLFALSEYHRRHLLEALRPDFPISVLYHPTEFPELSFDIDRYLANPKKRLIQIGWWLRKLNAIQRLRVDGLTPTLLGRSDWSKNLLSYAERRYHAMREPAQADVIDFLDNDAYDRLLTENMVFIDFYDTSANNAVIECLARATPIVVCRHPAVEEYLGRDYPLFYSRYDEVAALLGDSGRVRAANRHMRDSRLRDRLTIEHFRTSFIESEVIRHACR